MVFATAVLSNRMSSFGCHLGKIGKGLAIFCLIGINRKLPIDGDVKFEPGVVDELKTSTDSEAEAELVLPDKSLPGRFGSCPIVFDPFLDVLLLSELLLVGAVVTAAAPLSSFADVSKNDPVNDPQILLAAVAEATVDNMGLLIDCFSDFIFVLVSVCVSPRAFSAAASSSCISSALSMVFWASFNAVLARLAIPVASNQLILNNARNQ